MATAALRVQNPDAPVGRQQSILVSTREAHAYIEKRMSFPLHSWLQKPLPSPMLKGFFVLLASMKLPISQYLNAAFHWLVANDVGYMKL